MMHFDFISCYNSYLSALTVQPLDLGVLHNKGPKDRYIVSFESS